MGWDQNKIILFAQNILVFENKSLFLDEKNHGILFLTEKNHGIFEKNHGIFGKITKNHGFLAKIGPF